MQHSCSHYNAICHHSFKNRIELRTQDTTTRCKTHRRNNSRTKRPQPHPSHRRGTFHRRLQPLYTEKHTVSCSGFLPTTKPMQHSCSHSNAICHHSFKNHIELRTSVTTSLVPHHLGGTIRAPNFRFLTTSHRRGHHFIFACIHFPSSNTRFRASGFLTSQQSLMQHSHAAIPMRSAIPHHFPSSPLPFLTTPLHQHFPSSPLPFLTTSLPQHFPSSATSIAITTFLPHHSPSSPLPFVATSVTRKYLPSSPLPLIRLLSLRYIMYCYMIYHFPSSRSISIVFLLLLLCIGTLCIVHHSVLFTTDPYVTTSVKVGISLLLNFL